MVAREFTRTEWKSFALQFQVATLPMKTEESVVWTMYC